MPSRIGIDEHSQERFRSNRRKGCIITGCSRKSETLSVRASRKGDAVRFSCHILRAYAAVFQQQITKGLMIRTLILIRLHMYNLQTSYGQGISSLRTTQSRLITSLRRPPALQSYSFERESVLDRERLFQHGLVRGNQRRAQNHAVELLEFCNDSFIGKRSACHDTQCRGPCRDIPRHLV